MHFFKCTTQFRASRKCRSILFSALQTMANPAHFIFKFVQLRRKQRQFVSYFWTDGWKSYSWFSSPPAFCSQEISYVLSSQTLKELNVWLKWVFNLSLRRRKWARVKVGCGTEITNPLTCQFQSKQFPLSVKARRLTRNKSSPELTLN